MTTNIKPHRERIAVKRIDHNQEKKTTSGLIIPANDKDSPAQGTVVAVGPGYLNPDGSTTPLNIKVGDQVSFGKWAGTEITLPDSDEKLVIIKESDILATFN